MTKCQMKSPSNPCFFCFVSNISGYFEKPQQHNLKWKNNGLLSSSTEFRNMASFKIQASLFAKPWFSRSSARLLTVDIFGRRIKIRCLSSGLKGFNEWSTKACKHVSNHPHHCRLFSVGSQFAVKQRNDWTWKETKFGGVMISLRWILNDQNKDNFANDLSGMPCFCYRSIILVLVLWAPLVALLQIRESIKTIGVNNHDQCKWVASQRCKSRVLCSSPAGIVLIHTNHFDWFLQSFLFQSFFSH